MQDGPSLGRSREQRWSQAPGPDGSLKRLEALITAEFRVVHQELAAIRSLVTARIEPVLPPVPAPPVKPPQRRTLGRGLDALIPSNLQGWWEEGTGPERASASSMEDR